ncbi:hypothetical protein CCB80_10180 [Armatimonadetes bacterium Uphvl-Ar1]|nr:hypothetical protein CCB80_10180 [Armatimonadetes bacterium Uphvl-Ar1]
MREVMVNKRREREKASDLIGLLVDLKALHLQMVRVEHRLSEQSKKWPAVSGVEAVLVDAGGTTTTNRMVVAMEKLVESVKEVK